MYVTLVFRTKGTRLTKPTLCLILLSLAVLVGVVRVTEHRNHWNDVLAGFVTGGAIAGFLVREEEMAKISGISKSFEEEKIVVDGWRRVERQEGRDLMMMKG